MKDVLEISKCSSLVLENHRIIIAKIGEISTTLGCLFYQQSFPERIEDT